MSRGPHWWDQWFLGLAEYAATASKDPSTKVGAVIVRPNRTVASFGFNGFPMGIEDSQERYEDKDTKYRIILHAEDNAVLFSRESLNGYTLYTWPFPPCERCAVKVIQAGIARVVAPPPSDELVARWGDSLKMARDLFQEAGVVFEVVG